MKVIAYSFLSLFFISFITGCNASEKEVEGGANPQAGAEIPLHEKVQNLLIESDSAVPPKPDVYPVRTVYNREAVIPPMCYTQTEGKYNPCYVCHQDKLSNRENVMNDGELQKAYSFSDLGMKNHWKNVFAEREKKVNAMSDASIIEWINQDNYSELAGRLTEEKFNGWIPDLSGLEKGAEAFDEFGFAMDGSHWVAFNYKPFPSSFWPTNGSTDDVMIRLPEPYRTNEKGEFSLDVYRANLAIVEAKIKGIDHITTLPVDETKVGFDLDKNGTLSITESITDVSQYVGAAKAFYIDSYLYPAGTEFLHTVRYLGFDKDNNIGVSTRIKEVRYMKKWKAYPKGTLARYYEEEGFDKDAGHLPGYADLGHYGLDNDMGWSIQGFIENKNGRLRVSSFEENLFCMGCHGSIGSTIDKTFSFARKVDGKKGWGYIDLSNMPDVPNKGETQGEYVTYFQRAGGGDEFRSNTEMLSRWFNDDGSLDMEAVKNKGVYELIMPSYSRALKLNKAYKAIVEEQSFLFGRDATFSPLLNVYEKVDNENTPTLKEENTYKWDIILDWNKG